MTQEMQKKGTESLTIRQLIEGDAFKNQIIKALPRHLSPDRFIRIALTAMTKTPKLADCTKASLFNSLLNLSQLGLEPDGRRCHLIPFNNQRQGCMECQLIIDYKGLVELAMRTGKVSFIHADIVCQEDEFAYDKGEIKTHKINFQKPRGEMYAVYAICRFKDGTEKAEVMSREEVEKIRKRSKAGNSGPWVTDWNEMAKKTAFRRLSKWLELSPEQRDIVEVDDDRLPDGQWVPPTAKQPIFRKEVVVDPPPAPAEEEDNLPMDDKKAPVKTPAKKKPLEADTNGGDPSDETPQDTLLRMFIQDFGGTEGQLLSVLRADNILKSHETLEHLSNAKASALIKNVSAIHDRAEEMGSK